MFFVDRRIGYLFSIVALLVGISRVASGVHFPIDILVGYIAGIIISLFFNYLFKKFKKS
jgi:membrane-associated phospholipid phosphatase